jgi:hypothetical protein
VRVISSNLHSCHGIIEYFRSKVSGDLTLQYADIIFPEERLSCIVGRDTKFLLAVDERAAAGCCLVALSTEPLRSEVLFIHAMKSEETTLRALMNNLLSFLKSRRAPDLEIKYVEGMHSTRLRGILSELGFIERVRSRMLLEVSKLLKPSERANGGYRFSVTDSLVNWRATYIAATENKPFEAARKVVLSETPYGTIQNDDFVRIIGYSGKLPVGTIGFGICRNIGYVDRLSVITNCKDKNDLARRLIVESVRNVANKKCDYVVMDVDKDLGLVDFLGELGFRSVGKVSYFYRIVTARLSSESGKKNDER